MTPSTKHPGGGLGVLWERIDSFDIDGAGEAECPFSFERRLAQENGWSIPYARRVIGEYKRFVYLAMTAGHPVTPSDQVDQAWHLHLTYTRSYWERFCGKTLPRPLHHEPTKGGETEDAKFDDWYAKTKESYARIYGEQPPGDIWPEASVRFGDDLHYERINTKHHYVIPKRAAGRLARFGLIGGASMALVAGCTPLVLGQTDPVTMAVVVVVFFAILGLAAYIGYRAKKKGGSGCGGSGCSTGTMGFGSSGCGTTGGKGHGGHRSDGDSGSTDGSDSGGADGGGSSGCASAGCGGGGCGGGGD